MSQQNDTELWDLIQDSPADEAEAPGKKSGYQAPAKSGKNPWMFATIGLGAALAVTVGNDARPWQEALASFFAHWDGN